MAVTAGIELCAAWAAIGAPVLTEGWVEATVLMAAKVGIAVLKVATLSQPFVTRARSGCYKAKAQGYRTSKGHSSKEKLEGQFAEQGFPRLPRIQEQAIFTQAYSAVTIVVTAFALARVSDVIGD